jgi:hypothetical protein
MANLNCTQHNSYNCMNVECRQEMVWYTAMASIESAMMSLSQILTDVSNLIMVQQSLVNDQLTVARKQTALADIMLGTWEEKPPF